MTAETAHEAPKGVLALKLEGRRSEGANLSITGGVIAFAVFTGVAPGWLQAAECAGITGMRHVHDSAGVTRRGVRCRRPSGGS